MPTWAFSVSIFAISPASFSFVGFALYTSVSATSHNEPARADMRIAECAHLLGASTALKRMTCVIIKAFATPLRQMEECSELVSHRMAHAEERVCECHPARRRGICHLLSRCGVGGRRYRMRAADSQISSVWRAALNRRCSRSPESKLCFKRMRQRVYTGSCGKSSARSSSCQRRTIAMSGKSS